MEDGAIAGIVIACIIDLILIALLIRYCKKNSIWTFGDTDHERKGLFSGQSASNKILIKRCEQDNIGLRTVENEIIKRMHLSEKTWNQALDDGRTPVLVFCVNASRIGTDIENALRGVGDHTPVVMVVLHCKNSSSLRGDLSDDDFLLDQKLRDRVTGNAHFAFSDMEGFYSCRQNDDGYRKLSELLKHSKARL